MPKLQRWKVERNANSVVIPEWILKRKDISSGAILCYGRMCRYASYTAEGKCFPSQDRLAEDLNVSVRQVRSYVAELSSKGVIEIETYGIPKRNRYHFLVELPDENDPQSEDSNRNHSTCKTGSTPPPRIGSDLPSTDLYKRDCTKEDITEPAEADSFDHQENEAAIAVESGTATAVEQSFLTLEADSRVECKNTQPSPSPVARPPSSPKPKAPVTVFFDLWSQAYLKQFNTAYVCTNFGKEMKKAKALLAATKKSPEELVEIAVQAWDQLEKCPDCWALDKYSRLISMFSDRFMEVKLALIDAYKKELEVVKQRIRDWGQDVDEMTTQRKRWLECRLGLNRRDNSPVPE